MRESIFIIIAILTSIGSLISQKNDYIWFTGYGSFYGCDSGGFCYGINKCDFNTLPMVVEPDSFTMSFYMTTSSYCNDSGSLLFYSNGVYIANASHRRIENSDSLNYNYYVYNWVPPFHDSMYPAMKGMVILPSIDSSGQYYVIQTYLDTSSSEPFIMYGKELRYTLLDMNANGGDGRVLQKNQTLISSTLSHGLAACKHGNGRDWWVVNKKMRSNCYEFYLLDKRGISFHHEQCLGDSVHDVPGYFNSLEFSPDGSKFVFSGQFDGIYLYDFDRCNGGLSNYYHIALDDSIAGFGLSPYCNFSSSSRYLYAMNSYKVYQFDIEATDISASRVVVAIYNPSDTSWMGPYYHDFFTDFTVGQLGPDGKIYVSGGMFSTMTSWSIIHAPDSAGITCNAEQNAISLPNFAVGTMPYYPNYRLGRLIGSPCDTLFEDSTGIGFSNTQKSQAHLLLSPNPASNMLIADYGFLEWSGLKNVLLNVTNALGQEVYSMPIPDYSAIQRIDVSNWAAGIYRVNILSGASVKMSGSFVKE